MRRLAVLFALCALLWNGSARADSAGRYRADEGPELAAELVLRPDGTYDYALAYGALDEASHGRWREEGGVIRFVTEPKPVPPEFRQLDGAIPAGAPFLQVTWPGGRGIAGIDFRIGFEEGDPIEAYTQPDGWDWPAGETRVPRWIELAEPVQRLVSPRFAIAPGLRAIRFELVPNDFGIIDFTDATAQPDGDRLILHRSDATLKLVKATR